MATLAVGAVFAANLGASGFAVISPALGANIVSRRAIFLIYGGCVVAGALLFGGEVAKTLGGAIAPASVFTPQVTLIVLSAVGLAMLVANLLHIPQSTSWVTVFAIATAGLHHRQVDLSTLHSRLLPAWITLPLFAYFATRTLMKPLYPLRLSNMRLHERLKQRRSTVRWLVIAGGCYLALAVGANNVANAAGPVTAAGLVDGYLALLLFAPCFGIGAALMPGPAQMLGRGIVPLGPVSAAVASLVVGSLLLGASLLGIPQSLVQLQAASVLAISHVKEGSFQLMPKTQMMKLGGVWLGAPLIASAATWIGLEIVR